MQIHSIAFPFLYQADDYHEFGPIAVLLSKLTGKTVRHTELDTDPDGDYDAYLMDGVPVQLPDEGQEMAGLPLIRGSFGSYVARFEIIS